MKAAAYTGSEHVPYNHVFDAEETQHKRYVKAEQNRKSSTGYI